MFLCRGIPLESDCINILGLSLTKELDLSELLEVRDDNEVDEDRDNELLLTLYGKYDILDAIGF